MARGHDRTAMSGWRAALAGLALLSAACGSATPTAPTAPTPPPAAASPSLTCPAPVAVTTTTATAVAEFDTPAASGGEAPVTVACAPPSGQAFPIGTTSVRCTATDRRGLTGSCSFPVVVSRLPTLTATTFVAFGDSVTVGIIATENPTRDPFYILRESPAEAYPTVLGQLLAARYATQSITVINAGKGGERATDGAGRIGSVLATHRPDVVFVLQGYNDLGLGEAGIAPGLAAMNDIVKTARFRGARVFLATLTPPNRGGTRGLSNTLVTTFNAGLRSIARGENAVLVDLYEAMSDDPGRYNSDDGRHPNAAGYRRMAEVFAEVVRRELEVR